jgi:hypothetical protein
MLVLSFDIGIKNLAYCLIEHDKDTDYILDWNIIDCSEKSIEKIIKKMISELDNLEHLLSANIILIEKQPNYNRRMMSINNYVYMYYMIKTVNTDTTVINYSPTQKLKCSDIKSNTKSKNKYQINKRTAIEHARHFIKDTEWSAFYERFSKKDDLADSFLQAKSYFLKK